MVNLSRICCRKVSGVYSLVMSFMMCMWFEARQLWLMLGMVVSVMFLKVKDVSKPLRLLHTNDAVLGWQCVVMCSVQLHFISIDLEIQRVYIFPVWIIRTFTSWSNYFEFNSLPPSVWTLCGQPSPLCSRRKWGHGSSSSGGRGGQGWRCLGGVKEGGDVKAHQGQVPP